MKWRDTITDGYSRVSELLDPSLDGLSRADLDLRPCPDCNSIGWITWHLIRGQDAQIADLMDSEQVWIKEKWYEKFNLPAAPEDTGFGHTSEQVAAFKSPEADVFLGYYRACFAQTRLFISGLSLKELDRVVDKSYDPPVTLGVRNVSIMADSLQHSGEIAYLRGLLKGKGWLGF